MRRRTKFIHTLNLKKAWECCHKCLFLLYPSPPSSVDCVERKRECITATLHRGKGEGNMPHFNELLGLLYCPKSFHQGCRYVKGVRFVNGRYRKRRNG